MPTIPEMLEQQGPSLCIDDLAAAWGNQIANGSPGFAAAKIKGMLDELRHAIKAGELLVYSHEFKRERKYRASDAPELEQNRIRTKPETLNAWLKSQGLPQLDLPPSAESDSREPLDVPPQSQGNASTPSESAPDVATKTPSRKVLDSVRPYIIGILRKGRHATAKALHRELENRTGDEDSPFFLEKRVLRVKESGKSLSVKTVQNANRELRDEAGLS